MSTSPAARPEVAEAVVAEAAMAAAAAAGGTRVPCAAEGKRRVDFGAAVPPSKRVWATVEDLSSPAKPGAKPGPSRNKTK